MDGYGDDDYDNGFGMSDDELLYREMNPDDPWYMGTRHTPLPPRRNNYPAPDPSKGWGSQWPLKKQFCVGLLIGVILVGLIGLLSWLAHLIFD